MIKNVFKGYKKLFSTIGKIILLTAVCLATGFCIVFPLWKWATSSPKSYTLAILIIALAFFFFLIIKKLLSSPKKIFLQRLLRIIVILGGLALCIVSVMTGHRIIALAVLVLTFLLYGILAFGLKSSEK